VGRADQPTTTGETETVTWTNAFRIAAAIVISTHSAACVLGEFAGSALQPRLETLFH
jgi:hypothetical protein